MQWIRLGLGAMLGFVACVASAGTVVTSVDNSDAYYTSLRLNAGKPVISYFNGTNLRLATCTANCQTATPTWVFSTVHSGTTDFFSSLQLDGSGNPVVSYLDATNSDLRLATCTANCQTTTPTWVDVAVDSTGNVGSFDALQLNGGNPVIAYSDTTNLTLKLATCTANCQTATPTWVITTVDNTANVGAYASLQLNGGNPLISYYNATTGDLKLATCTAGCQTATPTWVITTVDSTGDVGYYTSLQLNAGNPVISYFDSTNQNLRLATCAAGCQTATPTWVFTTADAGANVGATSLQLNGGNPVIAYWEQTNRDLKLATCTANCQSATPTWSVTAIDSVGDLGEFLSMQLLAGRPVISYRDGLTPALKLAMSTPPPSVTSIVRAGSDPTAASSVSFTVTFSESVTGVDASDFALTTSGLTGASIASVSGSGTTYTVNVNTGTGSGTLRLDLVDDDSIIGSEPLGGAGAGNGNFTTGEVYTLDRTAPAIVSSLRGPDGNYATGAAVDVTVTFDKAITVDTTGGTPFIADTIGSTVRNGAYVSGSGTTTLTFRYTVQPADQDLDGIDVAGAITPNGATLRDSLGNDAALTPIAIGHLAGFLVNSDVTPNAFAFTALNAQPLSTVVTSNAVTISGIDFPVAISVSGGAYSIGCTATFTTAPGTIANGGTVCVQHTTSAAFNTTVTTTLTVGGGSGTFSSTTGAATPPAAPAITTITPGNGTATIVFNAPASNGGSAITSYTATCGAFSASGTGSPITVTGLANGTTYACSVVATNAAGNGAASAPVSVTLAATVPGAPTITGITPGNGTAAIALTLSSNGGSPITRYTATCTSSQSVPTAVATGTASPVIVTGLLGGGTAYSCSVIATNAVGDGPRSNYMSVTIAVGLSPTVPGAPTITGLTPSNGNLNVEFLPPASDGGWAITGYTATCIPTGAPAMTAAGAGSPIAVALTNGVPYNCSVTATNAWGTGPASFTSSFFDATSPAGVRVTMKLDMDSSSAGCTLASASVTQAPAGSNPQFTDAGVTNFTVTGCPARASFKADIASALSLPSNRMVWMTPVPSALSRDPGPPMAKAAQQWVQMPATISGSQVTFRITDGGLGDADGSANGSVVHVGGLAFAVTDSRAVPTLSEWAQLLMGLLLVGSGAWAMRARRGRR